MDGDAGDGNASTNKTEEELRAARVIGESVTDEYTSVDGFELPDQNVPPEKIEALYNRDSIVHREIYKEMEDLFGTRPEVITDNEKLKKEIQEILFGKKVQLYKKFRKATKGSHLNGMALIYLNYDGDENIKEPAGEAVDEVLQAGVIFRKDVHEYELDEDITSETFNEVKHWTVDVHKGDDDGDLKDKSVKDEENGYRTQVHSSRVLHVMYDTLYNDPWGVSRIGPEFDQHISRKIIVESAVSAFYQNAEGIRGFTLPPKSTKDERDLLENEIKGLNKSSDMMLPNKTEVQHPGPELADPTDLIDHLMETSTYMPYQILTGTQAGAVSGSETNLLIYYLEINKKRKGRINDMLVDKLEFLQDKGALPDGEFELDWGTVLPPNAEEEASILSKAAISVNRLIQEDVINKEEARNIMTEMSALEEI